RARTLPNVRPIFAARFSRGVPAASARTNSACSSSVQSRSLRGCHVLPAWISLTFDSVMPYLAAVSIDFSTPFSWRICSIWIGLSLPRRPHVLCVPWRVRSYWLPETVFHDRWAGLQQRRFPHECAASCPSGAGPWTNSHIKRCAIVWRILPPIVTASWPYPGVQHEYGQIRQSAPRYPTCASSQRRPVPFAFRLRRVILTCPGELPAHERTTHPPTLHVKVFRLNKDWRCAEPHVLQRARRST